MRSVKIKARIVMHVSNMPLLQEYARWANMVPVTWVLCELRQIYLIHAQSWTAKLTPQDIGMFCFFMTGHPWIAFNSLCRCGPGVAITFSPCFFRAGEVWELPDVSAWSLCLWLPLLRIKRKCVYNPMETSWIPKRMLPWTRCLVLTAQCLHKSHLRHIPPLCGHMAYISIIFIDLPDHLVCRQWARWHFIQHRPCLKWKTKKNFLPAAMWRTSPRRLPPALKVNCILHQGRPPLCCVELRINHISLVEIPDDTNSNSTVT